MSERTCLRCAVPAERGYLPDLGHYNSIALTQWVRGEPVRSFWTGLRRRSGIVVLAYRCPKCGGVELVAPATERNG